MRNILLVLVVGATACAARPARPTFNMQYTCGDASIVRDQDVVRTSDSARVVSRLSWQDDAGDHYVSWPLSPTDKEATEYIVPTDPKADAVERVYDTSRGSSTADWKLTHREACTAHGGYNDALARWMKGESIDDVARDFSMDRDEARGMVRRALTSLQTRYWRDR
jgi:hypothetical protein